MISEREVASIKVYDWIKAHPEYNAPWGVLESTSADRRYRSVTFGRARCLDAEVRIYSPKFVLVRWARGRQRDTTILKGEGAVDNAIRFIETEL